MVTNVILVRHGETDSNLEKYYMGWSAEDLNKTGYTQVKQLSLRLAEYPVAAIYTSPLKRALTTADIIAGPHSLTPLKIQGFIEIRLGLWEGLHLSEIRHKWPEIFEQWRTDPSAVRLPGGESLAEVSQRTIFNFNQVLEENYGQNIIIVTHEIIIKVIIPYILGCTNAINRRFQVGNASLTAITQKAGKFSLVTLNDTSHIKGNTP